jgi:predicted HTH domain antitoxin
MPVTLELPFDLCQAARLSPDDVRQELALHLYREGKLSLGRARDLAGLDPWAFMHLLGARGVEVHYDVAEYEADLATLHDLRRP